MKDETEKRLSRTNNFLHDSRIRPLTPLVKLHVRAIIIYVNGPKLQVLHCHILCMFFFPCFQHFDESPHYSLLKEMFIQVCDEDVCEHRSNVLNTTWEVAKMKPEKKIQTCTWVEPMTSAIRLSCITNRANKPTGSWSFCGFITKLWRMNRWVWIYEIIYLNYCYTSN